MKTMAAVVVALASSATMTTPAWAQPVEYTFSGVAAGFFDAQAFNNTRIQITLAGDLSDVFSSGPGLVRFQTSAAILNLDGLATDAVFNPTLAVTSNQNRDILVLGNVQANLALAIFNDPAFVDYDLSAPFGPVTQFNTLIPNQFNTVGTSQGLLTVTAIGAFTFTATVIPAPATLAPLALGLLATRRRR